jgi:hypothetical protein
VKETSEDVSASAADRMFDMIDVDCNLRIVHSFTSHLSVFFNDSSIQLSRG